MSDSVPPQTGRPVHTRTGVKLPAFHHHPLYRKLLHHSRTLHTYSTMLALILFCFFAVTGFMLNHSTWFGLDATRSTESEITIPPDVLAKKDKLAIVEYLRAHAGVTGAAQDFDLPTADDESFHISFKSPRSHSDVDITPADGSTKIATETRGVAGLMAKLHTAREAGPAWQLMLDVTSFLLLFASLSGFVLWYSLPKRRTLGLVGFAASIVLIVATYWWAVP